MKAMDKSQKEEQGITVAEIDALLAEELPPEPDNVEEEYDEEFNFSDR